MRSYMRINRLVLVGIFVAALLSWWVQGSVMTTQVEHAYASPIRISNEMEVPAATVQESKEMEGVPIPVQVELRLSDGQMEDASPSPVRTSNKMEVPTAMVQESKEMEGVPIPIHDELGLLDDQMEDASASQVRISNEMEVPAATVLKSKEMKGVPIPVQDELSLLDAREMHCLPCPPCPTQQWPKTPRRMGHHASDQKHPHHSEKDHPPRSAPAPHPHHQEKVHPPPSAPTPHPHHQEKDNPLHTAPAPASPGNGSTDPTQSISWRKEVAIKALKICGNVLSTSPLPLPFVIYWTTGYLDSTIRFYSKMSLGSTALSSYAWLMYSILQGSYKDKEQIVSYKDKEQIVGVEAIVVNGITWGVLAFMFMFIVMHEGLTTRGKRCIVGLFIHSLLTILLIQFSILRWVKSKSLGEKIAGGIAATLQVLSEIIPLFLLWRTWGKVYPLLGHRNGPAIRNYKKMTIVARAIDGFITLYWMQFCISTYNFDAFGIANVISAALSIISFVAHSAWALKPSQ